MAEHSETPRLCHPLSRVSLRGRLGQPSFASGSPIFLPALSSPSPGVDQRPRLALRSPLRPASVLACLWHLQAGPPQGSGSIGSPVRRAGLRPRALQPVQVSTGVLGDEVCRGPTPELLLQHSAGRRLIITERRKGEEGERDGPEDSPHPDLPAPLPKSSPSLCSPSEPPFLHPWCCQGSPWRQDQGMMWARFSVRSGSARISPSGGAHSDLLAAYASSFRNLPQHPQLVALTVLSPCSPSSLQLWCPG